MDNWATLTTDNWIDCETALPGGDIADETVLVIVSGKPNPLTTLHNAITIGAWCGDEGRWYLNEWADSKGCDTLTVSYWRRLPALPDGLQPADGMARPQFDTLYLITGNRCLVNRTKLEEMTMGADQEDTP